jgi:hypothetical protein
LLWRKCSRVTNTPKSWGAAVFGSGIISRFTHALLPLPHNHKSSCTIAPAAAACWRPGLSAAAAACRGSGAYQQHSACLPQLMPALRPAAWQLLVSWPQMPHLHHAETACRCCCCWQRRLHWLWMEQELCLLPLQSQAHHSGSRTPAQGSHHKTQRYTQAFTTHSSRVAIIIRTSSSI